MSERQELVAAYAKTNKNYAVIWDELSFLPPNLRASIIQEIQSKQRDRIDAAARRKRQEQLRKAEELAEQARQLEAARKQLRDAIDPHQFDEPSRGINLD